MMWASEPFWMLVLIKVFRKPVWKLGTESTYVFWVREKAIERKTNHDT
jgi:hypothetical protein